MEHAIYTRRDFLKFGSVGLALPLVFSCHSDSSAQVSNGKLLDDLRANAIVDPSCNWCGARDVPATVTSRTKLASDSDTGDRILISGTVYGPDGKQPAAGTLIYLYHTDVHGIYGRSGEHRHGRYRGWILTDQRGRYEFETIMPASYPNSTISKHVHMTVTTRDRKEDWIDSILFDGDKFLRPEERKIQRGGYDPVLKLTKNSAGILTGVRDIRLG
jgi:protocatechuate 3,4-dioxygenase, beta subunit